MQGELAKVAAKMSLSRAFLNSPLRIANDTADGWTVWSLGGNTQKSQSWLNFSLYGGMPASRRCQGTTPFSPEHCSKRSGEKARPRQVSAAVPRTGLLPSGSCCVQKSRTELPVRNFAHLIRRHHAICEGDTTRPRRFSGLARACGYCRRSFAAQISQCPAQRREGCVLPLRLLAEARASAFLPLCGPERNRSGPDRSGLYDRQCGCSLRIEN
jgi:hypothetical protein